MPLFRGANLSHGQTDYEMSNVQHCVWWRFVYFFIMSYLPRSTPSVRSTVLPGAPAFEDIV